MLPSLGGVLFDGFAYGMLLFLLSVGLSVTLGMMNFINLAHGSFGMLGGYVTVTLMDRLGWAVPPPPPGGVGAPAAPGWSGRASVRRSGRRSTTSAWRAAWASTSTLPLPSPSRWEAGSPDSAARWRSPWSASAPLSPSPTSS